MNVLSRLLTNPIKKTTLFCVLAVIAGFVLNRVPFSKKTTLVSETPVYKCVQKEHELVCRENSIEEKESIFARLRNPIFSKENSREEKKEVENTSSNNVSNQQNTNNNTNSTANTSTTGNLPTPTTLVQQPTTYQTPTNTPQPTQVIVPTQLIPTTPQVPTPTQMVAVLHVTSCGWYDINYCRNNGQTYNYTRLRVKRSDTGEVLHASTLNNGGGYFSGFPLDTNLDVILLPPIDNPDRCGDIKTIKFEYGHNHISVELIIRPSGSSPCITP